MLYYRTIRIIYYYTLRNSAQGFGREKFRVKFAITGLIVNNSRKPFTIVCSDTDVEQYILTQKI